MTETQALADDRAIRDLCARYIDAVNRTDGAAWQDTWAENGTWNLMGTEVTGREPLLGFWQAAMSGFKFALMVLNSGAIDISGDTASGRWYVTEHLLGQDGNGIHVEGAYDDEYVRENGRWLFARRNYQALYQGPQDLSGTYTPYSAPQSQAE